ncbi:MAG TPA: NifU family protein [Terriglobales bacterium]|nr:NifU family protein [Terriglobales bacterium]
MNNSEFQAHTEKIEQLVERVASLADEEARATALELLQSLMDLHGAVISRIVEMLATAEESGRTCLAKLGSDPLICGLMVLYGVHPVALEERVSRALEKVRRQLHKQGGKAELIGIADGVVRVTIDGSAPGCGSSPDALKLTVENAIREAAPEVVEIEIEDVPSAISGFVPLNMIHPAIREEKKYEESAA